MIISYCPLKVKQYGPTNQERQLFAPVLHIVTLRSSNYFVIEVSADNLVIFS